MEIDKLHHAYLLIGQFEEAENLIDNRFSAWGISRLGNPDYFELRFETFGIDEARNLSEMAQRGAFGNKKFFLILPHRITREAQNALLKTFEEPVPDTHFFLVASEEEQIIPTLVSRMMIIKLEGNQREKISPKKFVTLPLRERINFARDFEENISEFLDGLLLELRAKGAKSSLEKVLKMRKYSNETRSPKLILEYLSLIV